MELALDLGHWVNDGLMVFCFLVVGLKIICEFDMGELRERRRVATPVLAAIGGMVAPALIYLAFTAGGAATRGWAIPMGTGTPFALGVLALVGRRCPPAAPDTSADARDREGHRCADVIALAYTDDVAVRALAVAVVLYGVVLALRRAGTRHRVAYFIVGLGIWLSMLASGVHPTLAGSPSACSPPPIRPHGRTSSVPGRCGGCSASSRPPATPARRASG